MSRRRIEVTVTVPWKAPWEGRPDESRLAAQLSGRK
ncbi:hypothetical protein GZL_08009 [Streptomyces sp. 769]|nr:hypothetical protein GZL_08009 [Streptomyces sp. 769]